MSLWKQIREKAEALYLEGLTREILGDSGLQRVTDRFGRSGTYRVTTGLAMDRQGNPVSSGQWSLDERRELAATRTYEQHLEGIDVVAARDRELDLLYPIQRVCGHDEGDPTELMAQLEALIKHGGYR